MGSGFFLGEFSDVFLKLLAIENLESVLGDGGHLHVGLVQLLLHHLLQDGHRLTDRFLQSQRLVVDLLQSKNYWLQFFKGRGLSIESAAFGKAF